MQFMGLGPFQLVTGRPVDKKRGDVEPANQSIFLKDRPDHIVLVAETFKNAEDQAGFVFVPLTFCQKTVEVG